MTITDYPGGVIIPTYDILSRSGDILNHLLLSPTIPDIANDRTHCFAQIDLSRRLIQQTDAPVLPPTVYVILLNYKFISTKLTTSALLYSLNLDNFLVPANQSWSRYQVSRVCVTEIMF